MVGLEPVRRVSAAEKWFFWTESEIWTIYVVPTIQFER
jgi:hypothetical protein